VTPEQQAGLRTALAKERKGKRGRPAKTDAEKTNTTKKKNKQKDKKTNQQKKTNKQKETKTKEQKKDKKTEKQREKKTSSKVPKTPLKPKNGRSWNLKGDKPADPEPEVPAPPKKRGNTPKNPPNGGKCGPEILAVYGCSRCRYAAKGCTTCKNPNFKPRKSRSAPKEVRDVD